MMYKSTRGSNIEVTASQAILKGLSEDQGLFVPTDIPKLPLSIEEMSKMDYKEIAYTVMKEYLTDFTKEELRSCIEKAYDEKFDTKEIAPLFHADNAYYLELFHGKTIAFKDMALSILPYLLTVSAKKNKVTNEIVILTATSGDTGKAALAGFAGVEGTKIIVFYPKDGVSPIQERQMVTQKGDNTHVIAVHGNFDHCQTGVKEIFSNKELGRELEKAGYQFSSANSINIGRLIPQIVYYVYAYCCLYKNGHIKKDEKINIVVPTGNFGNILAAYYGKKMGLPIHKLLCASNENKVLYDFFQTGFYNKNREFKLTSSPSMDILISSNLERLIYLLTGEDPEKTMDYMEALKEKGEYKITDEIKRNLEDFYAGYSKEEETFEAISSLYKKTGYVIDTHTGVGTHVYNEYIKETKDKKTTIISSTASPYKFTRYVMEAIDKKYEGLDAFVLADELWKLSGVPIPRAIEEIRTAPILHNTVCQVKDMERAVKEYLGVK